MHWNILNMNGGLHRPIRPVIVGPLWGVDSILCRNELPYFVVFVCLIFPHVSFVEFAAWNWDQRHRVLHPFENAVKQLLMYEYTFFVHCRFRSSTIVGICFIHHRRLEFFWFWAQAISFFILAHWRNIVWDGRAIDRKLPAREIDWHFYPQNLWPALAHRI